MQYLSQNKSADFAEGLFWELCYQHENKRFKIYLDMYAELEFFSYSLQNYTSSKRTFSSIMMTMAKSLDLGDKY